MTQWEKASGAVMKLKSMANIFFRWERVGQIRGLDRSRLICVNALSSENDTGEFQAVLFLHLLSFRIVTVGRVWLVFFWFLVVLFWGGVVYVR